MAASNLDFRFESAESIELQVTSDRLNAMLAAIKRAQPPAKVRGGRLTQTDTGWALALEPGGLAAGTTYPLKPQATDTNKIRIRYGTVHGLVPKIGESALLPDFADPSNPELTVSAAGVIYVKVDLAADTYAAENPQIIFVAGDETDIPADVDEESAHHLLASISWESGAITNIAPVHRGSLDVVSCGGVANYWDLG